MVLFRAHSANTNDISIAYESMAKAAHIGSPQHIDHAPVRSRHLEPATPGQRRVVVDFVKKRIEGRLARLFRRPLCAEVVEVLEREKRVSYQSGDDCRMLSLVKHLWRCGCP